MTTIVSTPVTTDDGPSVVQPVTSARRSIWRDTGNVFGIPAHFATPGTVATFRNRSQDGFSGGAQIGYNWQLTPGNGVVFGVEADAQYLDFGRNRNNAFIAGTVLITLAIAWGMARYELVSRAKRAYLEGEKYYAWMSDQPAKKKHFDAELAAGKIKQEQYELLMEDSDLKNAFVWYETVIELFQPPKSEWVVKSEERMKEVKPKYIAWLKTLGIEYVE